MTGNMPNSSMTRITTEAQSRRECTIEWGLRTAGGFSAGRFVLALPRHVEQHAADAQIEVVRPLWRRVRPEPIPPMRTSKARGRR